MAILIQEAATDRGSEPALIDERGETTWSDLHDRVDRLVEVLRSRGLAEGDSVLLMAGNRSESIEVALACMHGGWLLVPVNWHWVAAEVAHVLNDCEPRAVFADRRWSDEVAAALSTSDIEPLRVMIGADASSGDRPGDGDFEDYEDLIASAAGEGPGEGERGGVMFYTSGTTGHPKGVRGGLSGIGGPPEIWQLVAASIGEMLEFDTDDQVQLVCGPLYHSAQWVFALVPLVLGATVVLQHRFDAQEVLDLIDEHRVTNIHMVPTQFVRLLQLPDEACQRYSGESLRQVHHGAAPCPEDVKRQMIAWWGPIVTEYYGGTEGGFITIISADEWAERPASVGRPVSTVDVLVVGDDGRTLGPGEVGDLYFRSKLGVDFEYHNAAEKTADAHLEEGVGTLGDVGWLDDDGYLFLSDRRIDMIISGGVNIYPAEIESVLGGHPSVTDVAVFGVPHDEMGEQVLAAVVVAEGVEVDDSLTRTLEAHVRERLAGYKVPRRWEFRADLPRTDTGKLLKRELRDRHWSDTARSI